MWYKNFRQKKMQTSMIFMIIMLCTMLLTAAVSILISIDKPYMEFAKECESPSAILYPYSHKEEEVMSLGEQFTKLEDVERVEFTKYHYILEEITSKGKRIEGFIKITEYNDATYNKIRYLEGDSDIVGLLKADECILPAAISNENQIHIGDKIKIQLVQEVLEYTVKGIYSDPYNTATAFDCEILVIEIPESMHVSQCIKIYGRDGATGDEIEDAYREKYNVQMKGEMQTLEERISRGLLAGNIIGAVFFAIGIIMLFVSCLIIHFMIRNTMITDSKKIAVYKTIGYTSGDITKMYLLFYFILVSAACVVGVGCSVLVSNIILSSVFENMGQVVVNNILLPGCFCYTLIMSFVLLIIYQIIGKSKKVKPVYALNGMSNSSTKKKRKYKGNSKLQFSALGIAFRNLTRNKKSAISILITSAVTIFSINFGIICIDVANTMKDNNDYWLGVDKCEVMIGVPDSDQFENIRSAIEGDDRVDYYICNNLERKVTMEWKKGRNTTSMQGFVYESFKDARIPILKGRDPQAGDEIAISSKISKEFKKDIGDYIEVYLGGEKRVNLLISGIFQTYYSLGDACRMTTAVYTENNYKLEYNNFSIYLKNKEDISSFIKDINETTEGGNVVERTEVFSSIMDMIVVPQQGAIPPVVALVLLVGGINIFSIVMLKNANNEKMNGIYKCLGYSSGHLILSNLYYVGMIAVVAIVVTVPMILIFYPNIMKLCLSMFGFLEYPVSYNIVHLIVTNIGILVVFILSTLISSRSLRKVNVRDLVQE